MCMIQAIADDNYVKAKAHKQHNCRWLHLTGYTEERNEFMMLWLTC